MSNKQGLILAARRDRLPVTDKMHGFYSMDWPAIAAFFANSCWLGPRDQLEGDPSFLQLIPYVALVSDAGVLCYRRSPTGGESRLHGELSLGFGGHVDAPDVYYDGGHIQLLHTLEGAAAREVREEVGRQRDYDRKWAGVIVDNKAEVGRVHIGVAQVWRLQDEPAVKPEHAILDPHVLPLDEVELTASSFESWSQMMIESGVLRGAPSKWQAMSDDARKTMIECGGRSL